MQEVLEDLATNKLNFDEYPYVQPPAEAGALLPAVPLLDASLSVVSGTQQVQTC